MIKLTMITIKAGCHLKTTKTNTVTGPLPHPMTVPTMIKNLAVQVEGTEIDVEECRGTGPRGDLTTHAATGTEVEEAGTIEVETGAGIGGETRTGATETRNVGAVRGEIVGRDIGARRDPTIVPQMRIMMVKAGGFSISNCS